MRRAFPVVAVLFLLVLTAGRTFGAGPYADQLSKCLVRSTTSADKSLLVQWLVAMCTLHPDAKWMSNISDARRTELNKNTAGIFERLLTEGCRNEARDAVKYEGEAAIESSFNVLGQVAARELFSNPNVASSMAEFGKVVDLEKIKKAVAGDK